ncbi:MAG: Crp/Fnr family transcriptional regulator [Deltaproteobacteria bacterium]|nr:Crp/Fnr family transcriptional regulator [Deltaproteobacteria bacterium]
MDDLLALTASIPMFSGLTEPETRLLSEIAVKRDFQKAGVIFFEGEYCEGFYVVAGGQVKITKVSARGKEQILYVLEPGEPFGQLALYHGDAYPATAQALSKCTCLFFPRQAFLRLVSEVPTLPMKMLSFIARRHRELVRQLENIALKEVPERLAGYLLLLAKEQEGSETVTLPISKEQLSHLLGTSPETLSRVFAKMAEEGNISMEGKKVTIISRVDLEILSQGQV